MLTATNTKINQQLQGRVLFQQYHLAQALVLVQSPAPLPTLHDLQ
jgi:hypothetical protein